jgi:CelD/BcsL family acetyltransferase involved in cellulose biosynthesis
MKVTVFRGRELGADLVAAWRTIQDANPALRSPYFCPEFTQLVAETGLPIEVAVIEEDGRVVGFFPFQRNGRIGGPVGGILSDYQGVVCRPEHAIEPARLVRACGLAAWDFDHLLDPGQRFAAHCRSTEPSPQIDLSSGFAHYERELKARGSDQIKKAANLARRIEREVGPLRFVAHAADPDLLRVVLGWKSQQYLETGQEDLFRIDWFRAVVERVHATQTAPFSGALSVLFAGERPVAGHMGMRSGSVWHYWFPAYDSQFAKCSPGILLLLKLAEHAAGAGIALIDLGKGMSLYKERLMTGAAPVGTGGVELPSWTSFSRRVRQKVRSCAASVPGARRLASWVRFGRKFGR